MGKRILLVSSALLVVIVLAWWIWRSWEPAPGPPSGQALYESKCALCHGTQGDGLGPAAYLLEPKPRRFRAGKFRLVSSSNGAPTREDLFRTISNGMPGTAMPSWGHLSEEQRWALVDYILELNREGWVEVALEHGLSPPEAQAYAEEMMTPGEPVQIPPEPPVTQAGLERGRELYLTMCRRCHGEEGEGRPDPTWRTAEGFPVPSRDLRAGIFKGGREGDQLFLRLSLGLPGSPMPVADVQGEELWHVVHFVQSLSDPEAQEKATLRRKVIRARKVPRLPAGPEDGTWQEAEVVNVPLMPLWWRSDWVKEVQVRVLHDGTRLAFLLEWEDPGRDDSLSGQQAFSDGAAVQLSDLPDPPLFAMGESGRSVDVWHWKAAWEQDKQAFRDVTAAFPRLSADAYFGREEGWRAEPLADPLFAPAQQLNNSVSRLERASPVEAGEAAGLGTLRARPPQEQNVQGRSSWEGGRWRVQLERELAGAAPRAVSLDSGETASVAFAIWDGAAGDRNGQKAVSIWNALIIQ